MTWKEEWNNCVCDMDGLRAYGLISGDEKVMEEIIEKYPISIPRYYLSLIDKNDPKDPIRRMCVPSPKEMFDTGSFDTSGEKDNTKIQGLQHKYPNTAMVLSTNVCAMYCRHCFRKRLIGTSEEETVSMLSGIVDYIMEHREIDNILISGGDTFMNSNYVIERFLERLSVIEHIRFIRFGTRVPVVLPLRIYEDHELLDILKKYDHRKKLYVVTQFNHPRELTKEAARAIKALQDAGIPVSNQTVLLRGVNDEPKTLAGLMNGLTVIGVIPYYVFQCRPVTAVKEQFQVPLKKAADIVERAKALLNGHAKRFKFVMSHEIGKLEILGVLMEDQVLFKFHQPKYEADAGKMFAEYVEEDQCWLDNIDD